MRRWFGTVAFLLACSGPAVEDAGIDGRVPVCERDEDCDDGLFCSGAERCAPGDPAAAPDGCVRPAASPCGAGEGCVEESDSCSSCALNADADGDGEDAIECGGTDCDDTNPLRGARQIEVCDAEGLDEDCDPTTIGPDADRDGFVRLGCCNAQPDGSMRCGTDCDDTNINVAPGAPEICDGRDNDCVNGLDFPGEDDDGDGWADCVDLPPSLRDCDDTDPAVHPMAEEICDGVDSDCSFDAVPEDADGDGHVAPSVMCEGGLPRDDCDEGSALGDGWRRWTGAPEVCDGFDNDCDDMVDESCATVCDPSTESGWASIAWLSTHASECASECPALPFGVACAARCALARAGVGVDCEMCVNTFLRCGGLVVSTSSDCSGGVTEDCRRSVCDACQRAVGDCSGMRIDECAVCDGVTAAAAASGLGALALCQTAACSTPECVSACVAERAAVGVVCAGCFEATLACQTTTCAAACGNPRDHACRACIDSSCLSALSACTGTTIAPARCTSTEAARLRAVASDIRECQRGCFSDSCLSDCVHTHASPTTVSASCAGCYGLTSCALANCGTPCGTGTNAECDACLCAHCEDDLVTCTGFSTGLCL